ncbi:MAG: DNA recombination protein RmuC [Thermodesulfobacteriota bacterium]
MTFDLGPLGAGFLAGGVVGALVIFWHSRWRVQAGERAWAAQLAAAQQAGSEAAAEVGRLRAEVQAQALACAKAEEKAGRLPHLEALLAARQEEIACRQEEAARLQARAAGLAASLAAEREKQAEKLALLQEAQARLADQFQSLAAAALRANNASFLELAATRFQGLQAAAQGDLDGRRQAIGELVRPVQETLARVDERLREIEQTRVAAQASLETQIRTLQAVQQGVEKETANLVKALRAPSVRGRWGEMQLRRVVEVAGLLDHCDFVEQKAVGADGRLRPDMVVRLPNGRSVVVDAKVPLAAYLDAVEATDEERRRQLLSAHARQVRQHLERLASKAYWEQFPQAPELAVLFLPGETFFSAALEQDPSLIEAGASQQVILATPTTLIALLRAVAFGWRQEQLAAHAQAISDLGRTLYDRLLTLAGHFQRLHKGLEQAVRAHNDAVGSLEGRVLVAARRFREMGVGRQEELPVLAPVETPLRRLAPPEHEA